MKNVVVVGGIRTPYVKAGGAFKDLTADDLGTLAVKELLHRHNLKGNEVEEVIIGNVAQPAEAANVARVIALRAGLPQSISAYTVHRNCASGLQAVADAYDKIALGRADVVVAGGVESMSNIPFFYSRELKNAVTGIMAAKTFSQKVKALFCVRPAFLKPVVGLLAGLTDFLIGMNMGQTAEFLADTYQLGRKEQDEFAVRSNRRAESATLSGRLRREIAPVFLPTENRTIGVDVGPRVGQTMEALAKLKPAFRKEHGTVTAGNSSQITDGAAAVLVMSEEAAKALGFATDIVIRGYAFAGCEPKAMGLGPVYATQRILRRLASGGPHVGMKLSDMRFVEINEAFAAQVLACLKAFAKEGMGEINDERLNVNGGAIALGHPVGSSGTRLVLTLMNELRLKDVSGPALATLCIGGGQGGSMVIERR